MAEDGTATAGTVGAATFTVKLGNALGTGDGCIVVVIVLLEELLDFSPNADILGVGSLDAVGGVVGSGW